MVLTRNLLLRLKLPLELLSSILDMAEYWARSTNEANFPLARYYQGTVVSRIWDEFAVKLILEAGLERFDANHSIISENDATDFQGIAAAASFSHLPIRALRPVQPDLRPDKIGGAGLQYDFVHEPQSNLTIQRNRIAPKGYETHIVTWSYSDRVHPDSDAAKDIDRKGRGRATADGSFVRSLKLGDVVTVWLKVNGSSRRGSVQTARVNIYWAIRNESCSNWSWRKKVNFHL
ncbi:hypothetical protein J3459_003922 [Metarhizium acridum]|nr:hypothetical protein J3459_003922 [Metarhizium acridum]